MGQLFCHDSDLTSAQVKTFKLSVSAACRKMSADQILDIADQLHDIIRKRSSLCLPAEVGTYDACAGGASRGRELPQ